MATLAIVLAIGACGCWMAALQFAPMALQAVGSVGTGLAHAAENAAASGHVDDPGHSPADTEEKCDQLQIEVPGVIEFRVAQVGAEPQWRELTLSNSIDEPEWEPLREQDSAPGGWHPALNLAKMNFTPPLEGVLKAGDGNYLAYAPSDPRTSVEQDQLVSMTVDFGTGIGTFLWNGRIYQYSLVRQLPCFPASVAMK